MLNVKYALAHQFRIALNVELLIICLERNAEIYVPLKVIIRIQLVEPVALVSINAKHVQELAKISVLAVKLTHFYRMGSVCNHANLINILILIIVNVTVGLLKFILASN